MRVHMVALMIAGVLAPAGLAAAQMVEIPKTLETPGDRGRGQGAGPMASEVGNRHYRYLMRVQTLKERAARTAAQDGGQLTPDHAANLQHELDKLNRLYGVKPG